MKKNKYEIKLEKVMVKVDEAERAIKVMDEQMHVNDYHFEEDSYSIRQRLNPFMQPFLVMKKRKIRELNRLYKKVEKLRYKIDTYAK